MSNILRPEQIRTASLYPLKTLDERTGEYRLLITRYWPRGFHNDAMTEWVRALAPSAELLRAYKHGGMTWVAFTDAYRAEMQPTIHIWRGWMAARLRLVSSITLLCHEHDAPEDTVRCHRRLLRDMLLETDGDA